MFKKKGKKNTFQEIKSYSFAAINETNNSDYELDYTVGAKLTADKVSKKSAKVNGRNKSDDGSNSYDLRPDESQLVNFNESQLVNFNENQLVNFNESQLINVLICTKHETSGNVLLFTLKVCLDPFTRKNECELHREFEGYGFNHFEKVRSIALKTRNENIFIKLVKFSFPQNVPAVLTPIDCKEISDDILWEKKSIETEFCFVLENMNERDMENLYFFGAMEISHGSSKLLSTEFSFFVQIVQHTEDIRYQSLALSSNEEENLLNVHPIAEDDLADATDSSYENMLHAITTL